MKKKIAIMLTLILATGTFTACTAEEKMDNSSLSPTVSTSVGVSVSGETSAMATTETTIPEKATVSKGTEPSGQNTKTEEKADSGKNSAVVSATDPIQKTQTEVRNNSKNTVNSNQSESESTAKKETETPTQKPVQKPTEKPTQKPTEKPTQPPTKAKTVDVQYAVSDCIAYGQQLGMKYDSSLNTGNASWFSPTNTSYYDSTSELTSNLKSDVEYVAYYYQSSGIAPSNLSFNVITENNKIYVVYC
jgi:outer membrane biosynthesis protein TonB